MPAPDLAPPPPHAASDRPLTVNLHPRLVDPESLRGGTVIVVDALRASATIARAIESGAAYVLPALSVEDARAAAKARAHDRPFLGGERGGVLIEGFDLGNSPLDYTPEHLAGRPVIFTTSNGTAALLHAASAARVVVGSFPNLSAVCDDVADDPRPVHILCAGTRDEITLDDCLPAGAMVERLIGRGRDLVAEDSALLCLHAWLGAASGGSAGILAAMRSSRGGRNLMRLGMDADVAYCSTPDSLGVVPVFSAASGLVTHGGP